MKNFSVLSFLTMVLNLLIYRREVMNYCKPMGVIGRFLPVVLFTVIICILCGIIYKFAKPHMKSGFWDSHFWGIFWIGVLGFVFTANDIVDLFIDPTKDNIDEYFICLGGSVIWYFYLRNLQK